LLTGRLDLSRAGTFGISLGGEIAAQACATDPRLAACLIMDVWIPATVVTAGLRQPVLFLTRDADTMRQERESSGGWTEHDIAVTLDTMRATFARCTGGGYYVEVPGLFHVNFTDLPYWLPASTPLGLSGPVDGRRGFAIINAYSLAFFDRHLKGASAPLLDGLSADYPEATIRVRRVVQ